MIELLIGSNLNCQELDDAPDPDGYRTACMRCLRALCKARSIVPSSLCLRDVTREGGNPVGGGGFAVSPLCFWLIFFFNVFPLCRTFGEGRLRDTQVCLKVLRVFCPEEQKAKILRVSRDRTRRNYLLTYHERSTAEILPRGSRMEATPSS